MKKKIHITKLKQHINDLIYLFLTNILTQRHPTYWQTHNYPMWGIYSDCKNAASISVAKGMLCIRLLSASYMTLILLSSLLSILCANIYHSICQNILCSLSICIVIGMSGRCSFFYLEKYFLELVDEFLLVLFVHFFFDNY